MENNSTVRIPLSADLAETLRDNHATVEKMKTMIEAIAVTDQKTIQRLATKAGVDLNKARTWSYDGDTLVFHMTAEMPPQPTPVAPAQE
jgi:hypothetical protein